MTARRTLLAFVAGFAATIFFHQPMLWLLHLAGMTPRMPYAMTPVPPFGVPSVISLSFWGGVWGIILVLALGHLRHNFIAASIAFGAVAPTIGAWLINNYIKHQPMPATASSLIFGLLVNGAWGLGTALLFRFFTGK